MRSEKPIWQGMARSERPVALMSETIDTARPSFIALGARGVA